MSKLFNWPSVTLDTTKDIIRNIKIDQWDVSNVTDMSGMFSGCSKFNSCLTYWDVSKVKLMGGMFYNCKKFNSDLSWWNTMNVKETGNIFKGCTEFCSNVSNWNTDNMNMEECLNKWDDCPNMQNNPKFKFKLI